MGAPASFPGTPSRGFPALPAARWVAASVLLVGGMLAFAASFLPFGQAAYPATDGYPASAVIRLPAQDLARAIDDVVRAPYTHSVGGTGFWAFWLWGAPLILAALGAAALLSRRWTPAARTRVLGVFLVAFGVDLTLVSCVGYLDPIFGSQGATRTLAYGPAVTLLGYLGALVGTIWLTAPADRSRH